MGIKHKGLPELKWKRPESFAVEVGGVDEPGDLPEAGGRSTELTYHGLSKNLWLASISHLSTTGSLLTRFGYDYKVLGQISKWEIQEQGAGAHGGVSSGATGTDVLTMTYDGSDRLVNQVRTRAFAAAGMGRPSKEWNWRLDRGSNRLSEQLELFAGATGQGASAGGALNRSVDVQGGTDNPVNGVVGLDSAG